MLFTKVDGILKVLFGWVVRDWYGSSHVLTISVIGFQERMYCANGIERTISSLNSKDGLIRLEFLWR